MLSHHNTQNVQMFCVFFFDFIYKKAILYFINPYRTIFMQKKISSFSFSRIQKYLSGLLILTLFFTQTVQVNWFDKTNAGVGAYRDIVSIIVDSQTYNALEGDIKNYAKNIQTYLGQTRTAIVVVDENTLSSVIATKNESLYYEGESDYSGPSQLVGTVLIGNVTIPMVEKEWNFSPSLYPYVDFKEKVFVYDETSRTYKKTNNSSIEMPEIWHWVINPAVGREWKWSDDIEKIRGFLSKTNLFYTKQNRFADATTEPRVFYYDGFTETRSVDARSLYQYGLYIKNLENLAYNRYSKYLLSDINNALKMFDMSWEESYDELVQRVIATNTGESTPSNEAFRQALAGISGQSVLSDESFKNVPDIQTINHINEFLKPFNKIFNKKVLWDELKAIYNAGRYTSGTTVRADIGSFTVTVMDKVAQDTLRATNNALENSIEQAIKDANIIRPVMILDSYDYQRNKKWDEPSSYTPNFPVPNTPLSLGDVLDKEPNKHKYVYENYYFGELAKNIDTATGCTIARGWYSGQVLEFGKEILVEANSAFNVHDAKPQLALLQADNEELREKTGRRISCYRTWQGQMPVKIQSYWWGNSVLRIANPNLSPSQGFNPTFLMPDPTTFTGFTAPIYTLQWMRETDRLPKADLNACIKSTYWYLLRKPDLMILKCTKWSGDHEQQITIKSAYPKEWNRGRECWKWRSTTNDPRYTCTSVDLESAPLPALFPEEYDRYKNTTEPCLEGSIFIDGSQLVSSTKNPLCVKKRRTGWGWWEWGDVTTIDNTIYRNLYYHTLSWYLKHESPTQIELQEAARSGVTPNLAIDIVRSFEFQTPKGNVVSIEYPNFFRANVNTPQEVRDYLRQESQRQWDAILAQEQATTLSPLDQIVNTTVFGINPLSSGFDWNDYISDEDIVKLLQAKKWIHPDVTKKYKEAVETMLSYSHQYPRWQRSEEENPPKITTDNSGEYEIAYLGLTPFTPDAVDGVAGFSAGQQAYNIARQKIHAINITDQEEKDTGKPTNECGPPDGVIIWKWPAAIMCWIRNMFPIKVISGKCSAKTIWADKFGKEPNNITGLSPEEQRQEIQSATLVSHLPREVLSYQDSLSIAAGLETQTGSLILPTGTVAEISLLWLSSDGNDVLANSGQYISISPTSQEVQWWNAQFIVSSRGKPSVATLQITYTIPVWDENIRVQWEPFTITVSDRYLQVSLSQWGKPTYAIKSDEFSPAVLSAGLVSQDNTTTSIPVNTFTVSLYDDITGEFISSWSTSNGEFILPESIQKQSGSYRAEILGAQKEYGSLTFSVMAGGFAKIDIQSISTAVIGEETLPVRIRLFDANDNIIEPHLYSVQVSVEWGNIVLAGGEKKDSIEIDVIRGFVDLNIEADNSGNPVKITVSVDGKTASKEITSHREAQVQFIQAETPKAGWSPVLTKIQIVDDTWNPINGFNSVLSASFPQWWWRFEKEVIPIRDGISDPFNYLPGTQAWDISALLSIPWYGTFEALLSVAAWDAMYVEHTTLDNTIELSLRDRYGNIATQQTMNGTLKYNGENETAITFENGIYQVPRRSWYYQVRVPELENVSIEIAEASGVCWPLPENPTQEQIDQKESCRVSGIPMYSMYVPSTSQTKFDFLPDYNARYTILAGDSFLREWEDILYDSDPNDSQSLAVTTLLDSPFATQTLFNVLPWGGNVLGNSSDTALSSSIQIENWYPVLTVLDEVDNTVLAKVSYRLWNAQFFTDCQEVSHCSQETWDFIAISKSDHDDIEMKPQWNTLVFAYRWKPVASIGSDGSFASNGVLSLNQVPYSSANGLHVYLDYGWITLGEILYHADESKSIVLGSGPQSWHIVLDAKKGKTLPFSQQSFANGRNGYKIVEKQKNKYDIDSNKLGPDGITSIGELSESPNIGWKDDNTMMLSYAAWDTVWEATYRYHTYMMVNMWDPVAHVQNGRTGTQIDGIDRTVGTQIGSTSHRSNITKALHRDMNNDQLEDVVVVYADGYIELLLNFWNRFRSRDMLAYIPPRGKNIVELWDFSGDQYADIIAVGHSGFLEFWDNAQRKFIKTDITVNGATPPTNITQLKVYDMDNDGRDDIVYLTSLWKLAVLYGTSQTGVFDEVVLDNTLGISLSPELFTDGWALYSPYIQQIAGTLWTEPLENIEANDTIIKSLIYYQYTLPRQQGDGENVTQEVHTQETLSGVITQTITTTQIDNNYKPEQKTFMRSAYLTGVGLFAEKKYQSQNTVIQADETVEVAITITNNTTQNIEDIEYLDSIPRIFDTRETSNYTVSLAWRAAVEKEFYPLHSGEYDALFEVGTLAPGQKAVIRYTVKMLPASYGEMLVDDFERSTPGADSYGDVAFKTDTTCGGDMLLYLSTAARSYTKTTNNQNIFEPEFPEGVQDALADANGNGIPDSVEWNTQTTTLWQWQSVNELTAESRNSLEEQYDSIAHQPEAEDDNLIQFNENGTLSFSIDFNPDFEQKVEQMAEDFFNGLACGFGGGSCMSFPLNWAPLAPWSDPVAFGIPIWDWLRVDEWLPIFSALTWQQASCGPSPCCLPSVYPVSVQWAGGGICGPTSAGGYLGTWDATNTVRVFVTPTLTLGMGLAVCFGGPASSMGQVPPPGLFPLIQSGNCIVVAKAMPFCKWDGSSEDGDVSDVMDSDDVWNSQSCDIQVRPQSDIEQTKEDIKNSAIDYLRSPEGFDFAGFNAQLSQGNISSLNNSRPLLQIGPASGGGQEVIDISIDSNTDIADFGSIVNLKNKRIAGFPDFIMDWIARQTEEITNALFTPPNLTIIPPKDLWQNAKVDSTYKDFWSDLWTAYSKSSFDDLKQRMWSAYGEGAGLGNSSLIGTPDSWLGQQYADILKGWVSSVDGGVKKISWGLNAVQEAYKFLGNLPFIKITQVSVPINIPWVLPSELDQYEQSIDDYMDELSRAGANWCVTDPTPECLAAKAKLNSSALRAAWQANKARIQEYRQFPEKLKKYLNWKEKYLYQLMCNVEAIQRMIIGWLKDNGIRFQKWAELFVLLKAIAETWQPLLDIFANTSARCGVCRNERYNLQYWKFKLISILIPKVPVIQFPRWPDIILDLSDIRLGISIVVPEFKFRISPIRLPRLPSLSLPDAPNGSLTLPRLPVLPKLPTLPDLPNLPDLPLVDLPDLPPPPKLPKIFWAVKVVVNIMKLISKLYCYYQNTALVPEWNAGDVIAQRTERQGTLPIDFLDIAYPTFKIPGLKAIRVATHVNFELKADFLAEMARTAVKPINAMSSDFQRGIPNTIGSDVSVESPIPDIHIKPDGINDAVDEVQWEIDDAQGEAQDASNDAEQWAQDTVDEATRSAFLKQIHTLTGSLSNLGTQYSDVDEFALFFKSQLTAAWLHNERIALERDMQSTVKKVSRIQNDMIAQNNKKFEHIKNFIETSQEDIAIGNNIIKALRWEKDMNEILAVHSDTYMFASHGQDKTRAYNTINRQLKSLSHTNTIRLATDRELQNATKNIASRYENIVAQNTPTVSHTTSNSTQPIAQSYNPKFKGIYILTPIQKKQTRLFDYTDKVNKKTKVSVLDIDNDGDNDFLFTLDNRVYVKYNYTNTPQGIPVDTSSSVSSLDENSQSPFIPNYFDQNFSTPSQLNISFEPADPDALQWRMEFYDHYLDWFGEKDGGVQGNKMTVDLFVQESPGASNFNEGVASTPVDRSLDAWFDNPDFTLKWPNITFITGAINLSLSSERAIYTGKRDVEAEVNGEPMTLEKHTKYSFENTVEIQASQGPLFIIWEAQSYKIYKGSDDLEGLPILPWMQLISQNSVSIQNHRSNNPIAIPSDGYYISKSLGSKSDSYSFTIDYPNGYYYARLHNLSDTPKDRAGIVLLSPNEASDRTPPVVALDEAQRIPVYTTKTIDLKDVITELSNYSISIDSDISTDGDGDGIADNDFGNGDGASISSDFNLTLGAFDAPGTREMLLRVVDAYGSETKIPLSVEIYTPIPHITHATFEGALTGALDEAVEGEPVHIFRFRSPEQPVFVSPDASMTDVEGVFTRTAQSTSPETITLTASGQTFTLSPYGAIQNLPAELTSSVIPATASKPMTFQVVRRSDSSLVYEQTLTLPESAKIIDTSQNPDTGSGLLVTTAGQYRSIFAELSDPNIPNGMYITDDSSNPILALAKDGNIYTLDDEVTLSLASEDDYIKIIATKDGQEIATFVYKIDFYYTK